MFYYILKASASINIRNHDGRKLNPLSNSLFRWGKIWGPFTFGMQSLTLYWLLVPFWRDWIPGSPQTGFLPPRCFMQAGFLTVHLFPLHLGRWYFLATSQTTKVQRFVIWERNRWKWHNLVRLKSLQRRHGEWVFSNPLLSPWQPRLFLLLSSLPDVSKVGQLCAYAYVLHNITVFFYCFYLEKELAINIYELIIGSHALELS